MRYEALEQDALRGVVRAALKRAAADGPAGRPPLLHHLQDRGAGRLRAAGPAGQLPRRDDHRPAAPVLGPGAGRDLLLGDPAVRRPAQAAVRPLCGGHPVLRSRACSILLQFEVAGRSRRRRAAAAARPAGRRPPRRRRPTARPRSSPSTSSGRNDASDRRSRPEVGRRDPPALTDDAILQRFLRTKNQPTGSQTLGFRMVSVSQAKKTVEVAFEARAELLLNPMKQIQGGYLCAMLDECMSVACMVASGMTRVAPTAGDEDQLLPPGMPGPLRGVGRVVALGQDHRLHRGRALRRARAGCWPRPPARRCRRRSRTTRSRPMRAGSPRWHGLIGRAGCAARGGRAPAGPFGDWARRRGRRRLPRPLRRPHRGLRQRPARRHAEPSSRKGFVAAEPAPVLGAAGALPGHRARQGRAAADLRRAGRPDRARPPAAAWSTSPRTARRRAWC